MTTSSKSIFVQDLYKRFGDKRVLNGVNLELKEKTIFGLVGLNGAGKTTFIRLLLGLLNPDRGSCSILGINPSSHSPLLYKRAGVVLEHNGFFSNLSVMENLHFFAKARDVSESELHTYFEKYWQETDIGKDNRPVKYFSRGQRMQCALCRAFLGFPEVYFFDEPVVALDMEAYRKFCDLVKVAQTKNATILISSHQLDTIEELCTSVGILEKGVLTIVQELEKKKSREQWTIKTECNDNVKKVIEEVTGYPTYYKNEKWQLVIAKDSENVVPELVSTLVSMGCLIKEVKLDKMSFRDSIQQYYDEKK